MNCTRLLFSLPAILFGFVFVFAQPADSTDLILVDKIVATVGDEIVLHSEIEIQHTQAVAQGYPTEGLRCQLLDQLLLEKLLLTYAEIDSVVVGESEIEGELDNRFRYYINLLGSEEAFEEYFKKSVLEFREDFYNDVRDLLMAQRKQGEIIANVKVTPSEVKQFFNQIPADSLPYFNSEVQLSQIVIKPKVNEVERERALEAIRNVRQRLISGDASFEDLASVYSDDPGSAAQGGRLGMMARGQLVKEYEATAFKLQPGVISEVVETEYGFHIIELIERRGNRIDTRHILIKPEITPDDEAKTYALLDSLKQEIVEGTLDFRDAVARYSEDEMSKAVGGLIQNPQTGSTYFETDQLDPDVYFAIDALDGPGDITDPVPQRQPDGSVAYRLIQLISETPPHQANLRDDYGKLSEYAASQKQNQAMNRWVASRAKRTYIKIDDAFHQCPSIDRWLPDRSQ